MTTQIKPELKIEYVRGTTRRAPQVRVGFVTTLRTRLKILLWLLLGRAIWVSLSEEEIELISKHIVRWRVVTKLRTRKKCGMR